QDTGAHVLHVGFPLLNLPPGKLTAGRNDAAKRVLAPVAFVPVHVQVSRGRSATVELSCTGEKIDRVVPNTVLLTWIERQTGNAPDDLYADEAGDDPYREINSIVAYVVSALGLPAQEPLGPGNKLITAPHADDAESGTASVLSAAVLGLFPFSNQGLID